MRLAIVKTNAKTFTQLPNKFYHALLCTGALFVSFEVGAANINCGSDLTAGTLSSGPVPAAYGSCIVGGNPAFLVKFGPATIATTNNTGGGTFSPSPPTPSRNLGSSLSSASISDMGTATPTLSSCIGATYSGSSVSGTSGNWYCAKFVGSTDTGYMAAQWNGSVFVPIIFPPIVSAPIDFSFNHKQPGTFATEIELK